MKEEVEILKKISTRELVQISPSKKAVDNRRVFNAKRNANGDLVRLKERLVKKSSTKIEDTESQEVYSPVSGYGTLRLMISVFVM